LGDRGRGLCWLIAFVLFSIFGLRHAALSLSLSSKPPHGAAFIYAFIALHSCTGFALMRAGYVAQNINHFPCGQTPKVKNKGRWEKC